MRSKSFNIAIYPSSDIAEKAIKASWQFKVKGAFKLGIRKNIPHSSLYMAKFPIKNLPKMKKALHELAKKTKKFILFSHRYRQTTDGYVDIRYKKTNQIKKLQANVIDILNPQRKNLLRPKDKAMLKNSKELSKTQRFNIKKYGYRSVAKDFVPHLTFTKLAKSKRVVFPIVDAQDFSFDVSKIGIYELGGHGTCKKLIEEFELANKKSV